MTQACFLYDLIVVAVFRKHVPIALPEALIAADKKGPLARGAMLNRESPVHSHSYIGIAVSIFNTLS